MQDSAQMMRMAYETGSDEVLTLLLYQLMTTKKPDQFTVGEWQVIKEIAKQTNQRTPSVVLARSLRGTELEAVSKPYISDWEHLPTIERN